MFLKNREIVAKKKSLLNHIQSELLFWTCDISKWRGKDARVVPKAKKKYITDAEAEAEAQSAKTKPVKAKTAKKKQAIEK